jgi:hypothetical protein
MFVTSSNLHRTYVIKRLHFQTQWQAHISSPNRVNNIHSLYRPGRSWGRPSQLSKGYWGHFLRGKATGT